MNCGPEITLYAEIAKHLVDNIRLDENGMFNHMYMNPFEGISHILVGLKCAWSLDEDGEKLFKHDSRLFIASSEETRDSALCDSDFSRMRFEEMICCFLNLAEHHSVPILTRSGFVSPKNTANLLNYFAEAGYGEWRIRSFHWNDAIAPFMWSEGIWNSNSAEEAERIERHISALLENRPEAIDVKIIEQLEKTNEFKVDPEQIIGLSGRGSQLEVLRGFSLPVVQRTIANIVNKYAPNGSWLSEQQAGQNQFVRVFHPLNDAITKKYLQQLFEGQAKESGIDITPDTGPLAGYLKRKLTC